VERPGAKGDAFGQRLARAVKEDVDLGLQGRD
jgi:hypothetical protein